MNFDGEKVALTVEGMHCTGCASTVERYLKSQGATEVEVDFTTSSARFVLSPQQTADSIIKGISSLGYPTSIEGQEKRRDGATLSSLELKFLVSLLGTIPLLLHMVVPFPLFHSPLFQLLISTPVFIIALEHFGKSAVSSLRTGSANMDVLIIIGVASAYIYSAIGFFWGLGPDFLFFETAASITSAVLLGNVLERRAVKRTTSAIEELTKLQPTRAKLLQGSDDAPYVTEVPLEAVKEGDLVLVNTGDKIPVDGTVVWGVGEADESIVTGESMAVSKPLGSLVIGGTILDSGTIRVRTSQVGDSTVLAKIIHIMKRVQSNKPKIQSLGDKVSSIFVPTVVIVSCATLLLSYFALSETFVESMLRAIAVLVIACPCAVGLATPTAVMVSIGEAAKSGILIKSGKVLELLSEVKTVVFDKTGTLTEGSLTVRDWNGIDRSQEEIGSIVVGLERHSNHPIAKSLVGKFDSAKPATFKSVSESKGLSVKGNTIGGKTYEIGSRADVNESREHDVYLTENGRVIAWFDFEDLVRTSAKSVVAWCKKRGIETALLSGDRATKTEKVAADVGIRTVYSEKKPEEKLEIIERLERNGAVAFVGDGVNDAPSLARATVGVSLSGAAEAAIESAQVVLLGGKLEKLPYAIQLSERAFRVIKQNLFWAFFYNVLAIPVAAAGYLNPMVAALSMAFSDVIVIGNSLRLRRKVQERSEQ